MNSIRGRINMSNDFKVQFPDLFDEGPTNNLCIIGNGFDMHHGLDTSFSDFRNFLGNGGTGTCSATIGVG